MLLGDRTRLRNMLSPKSQSQKSWSCPFPGDSFSENARESHFIFADLLCLLRIQGTEEDRKSHTWPLLGKTESCFLNVLENVTNFINADHIPSHWESFLSPASPALDNQETKHLKKCWICFMNETTIIVSDNYKAIRAFLQEGRRSGGRGKLGSGERMHCGDGRVQGLIPPSSSDCVLLFVSPGDNAYWCR